MYIKIPIIPKMLYRLGTVFGIGQIPNFGTVFGISQFLVVLYDWISGALLLLALLVRTFIIAGLWSLRALPVPFESAECGVQVRPTRSQNDSSDSLHQFIFNYLMKQKVKPPTPFREEFCCKVFSFVILVIVCTPSSSFVG